MEKAKKILQEKIDCLRSFQEMFAKHDKTAGAQQQIDDMQGCIEKYQEAIAELDKLRWIRASERLPEFGQWILCYWVDLATFGNDANCEIILWSEEEKEKNTGFAYWKQIIVPE